MPIAQRGAHRLEDRLERALGGEVEPHRAGAQGGEAFDGEERQADQHPEAGGADVAAQHHRRAASCIDSR